VPAEALLAHGWSPRVEALVAAEAPGAHQQPGRVARVDYDRCTVVTGDGTVVARAASGLPAVGDWVIVDGPTAEGGDHTVASVVPRWSALERLTNDGSVQVMAADVDLVFITTGLDRPPNWNRLDRELVLAWDSGAQPVVVGNKADACDDPAAVAERAAERLGGVEVVLTSARTGAGIARLAELARPDRTVVFLGASGVGKTSLVNALVGGDQLATGAVREGDLKGRHTTTARFLVPLPGGGVLLDTPGVRSLGVADNDEGLASAFADIEALADGCRFRDCIHESEPGCAVRAAVGGGSLDSDRFESWRKLRGEMAWMASLEDPKERAERRRTERTAQRAYRSMPKR
jgi:ribosome biogenesis GTPase / thiamine phosphate phosphatase